MFLECQQINAWDCVHLHNPKWTEPEQKHTVPPFLLCPKDARTRTCTQTHTLTFIPQGSCWSWHHNCRESNWLLRPSVDLFLFQNLLFFGLLQPYVAAINPLQSWNEGCRKMFDASQDALQICSFTFIFSIYRTQTIWLQLRFSFCILFYFILFILFYFYSLFNFH